MLRLHERRDDERLRDDRVRVGEEPDEHGRGFHRRVEDREPRPEERPGRALREVAGQEAARMGPGRELGGIVDPVVVRIPCRTVLAGRRRRAEAVGPFPRVGQAVAVEVERRRRAGQREADSTLATARRSGGSRAWNKSPSPARVSGLHD